MKGIKNIIFGSDKEKLTEKAFRQCIAVSVFSILLCMIALCSVTWAWFKTDVSSAVNQIQSAHCDVAVSVAGSTASNGKYTLEKETDYTVCISASGSADSAYCILVVDGVQHYTAQIPIPTSAENVLTFTLRFSESKDIEIITCWGTSSKPETERTFKNGVYYYDLKESDPITTADETNTKAETTASEINSNTDSPTETGSVPPLSETSQ